MHCSKPEREIENTLADEANTPARLRSPARASPAYGQVYLTSGGSIKYSCHHIFHNICHHEKTCRFCGERGIRIEPISEIISEPIPEPFSEPLSNQSPNHFVNHF